MSFVEYLLRLTYLSISVGVSYVDPTLEQSQVIMRPACCDQTNLNDSQAGVISLHMRKTRTDNNHNNDLC